MAKGIYSADVKIVATMYVKANSPEHAREIMDRFKMDGLEFSTKWGKNPHEEIIISGATIGGDEEDFPAVSLSPAMTFYGLEEPVVIEEQHIFGKDQEPK